MSKNYFIINDKQTFEASKKHLEESEYVAFDTETTGLNPRKDKVFLTRMQI